MATVPARRHLDLEELCALPSFYAPLLSWKRDRVAFYWDRSGRIELYVMDLATKAVKQLSHGEVPRALRTFYAWDRTDTWLVFGKDQAGDEQHDLYRIEVDGGRVERLSSDRHAEEHPIEFSPDNQWLTVTCNRRLPEQPDRQGQMNIWRLRPDGAGYEPVTRNPHPTWGGEWSPDGQWIRYGTNDDPRAFPRNNDGYVVRPDGSDPHMVFRVRHGSSDLVADWHPDGRRMAVSSDASGLRRVGVLDLETEGVRWLTPDGRDDGMQPPGLSPSGARLVVVRSHDSELRPIVYDLESGEERSPQVPPGVASNLQWVDDSRLLLVHSSDSARPSMLLYDLDSASTETLLAPDYGSIDRSTFVPAEHVWYPSFDGRQIPAILYRPQEIAPGEPAPALVHVHGGPTAQWMRGWDPQAQFLVDRGLVVLEPNIRGSTGYGTEHRDAALGDWGGADLEDVAAGAEYLKSLPFVDGSRLAVSGGSYGGFMTFIAATKKPDLWKAAVARVGITDLQLMWEESREHFRHFLRVQMGDPVEQAELWADRSALNFASGLKAKLLILHGVNDPRCPISQARVFRDRLLELGYQEGGDFEYVEFGDEGHGSVDIEQRTRTYAVMGAFLDRAL